MRQRACLEVGSEYPARWSLSVPPLLVVSRDKLLHSKGRQQTVGWHDNSVLDRMYYRRNIISYFDWKYSCTAADSEVNYNAAENLEWNWVEGDYVVPFSNWNRVLNLFFKITNEPISMKENISYRSVQLLSPQASQLGSSVKVGKIIFSLSVKSCELLY